MSKEERHKNHNLDRDIEAAISLGAAVLTRIEDPALREIAIRNALKEASKGLPLSELDDMVTSAIEVAIETSPEFSYGWRSMPEKELVHEILDEIPIEYTEQNVADAIYRYKLRRLTCDPKHQSSEA